MGRLAVMRALLVSCLALACSGEPFSGKDDVAAGGGAGEPNATGGKSAAGSGGEGSTTPRGGSSGKSTGGTSAAGEGGEGPAAGGAGGSSGSAVGGSGNEAGCEQTSTFYRDVDGDGFGRDDETVESCDAPEGYAVEGGDCDDGGRYLSELVNPAADESCNDKDDNCDGRSDEDGACEPGCEGWSDGATCLEGESWDEAVATCETMELVLMGAPGSSPGPGAAYWLNANDRAVEGEWRWADSRELLPMSPSGRWSPGEPRISGCLGGRSGSWYAEDCSRELPFICENP